MNHRIETKHVKIREEIRSKILMDEYDLSIPPLRTLAKEFRVNVITMNKAIKALTEEGLLLPIRGKGIMLVDKLNKNTTIGLTSKGGDPFLKSGLYSGLVLEGILEIFNRNNINFSYEATDSQQRYKQLFRNSTLIDGILILAPSPDRTKELLELNKAKVPFITIGSSFEENEINYVSSDDLNDSYRATNYLIEKGHRKILLLTIKDVGEVKIAAALRLQGYKLSLHDHGIKFDPGLVCNTEAKEIVKKLKTEKMPTAIFASFSEPMTEVVKAILDSGIRIPQDVILLVYDDYKNMISQFNIPYLVVREPYAKIGEIAAEKLLGLIKGKEKEPIKINLASELVEISKKRG